MLFSSLTFIFYFLPLCILLYFIVPKIKYKNIILLLFSLVFYSWGEPKFILLMIFSSLVGYIGGLLIDKYQKKKLKRFILIATICILIGLLLYFKYWNFLLSNINLILSSSLKIKNIILPIGISFYTFQILSYVIDLYWGKIKVQKNYFYLLLYISFFPQLIAGPIVRYETIEKEINDRHTSYDDLVYGIKRFIIGLGKKVLIANQMALLSDTVFDSGNIASYSSLILLISLLAYTFQIYFDFSGYSDMAIGLGRIFGFHFLENFNYPYLANSITDFWNRWHISLSSFFKEYIYIPLGGNRVSKKKWIRNLFVVWLLTGLWHGAAWNFILWGLYFFVLLVLEKTLLKKIINKMPKAIRYIITCVLIMIGWLLFRVNTLNDLWIFIKSLILNNGNTSLKNLLLYDGNYYFALFHIIIAIIASTNVYIKISSRFNNKIWFILIEDIVLLGVFIICIASLVSNMYNPFIYFRF